MWLHVRIFRAEKLLYAVEREVFRDVHPLATAVIAFARIALGVFVCEHRTLRFHNGK